jgi:hypothetical protein
MCLHIWHELAMCQDVLDALDAVFPVLFTPVCARLRFGVSTLTPNRHVLDAPDEFRVFCCSLRERSISALLAKIER